jgi:nucleotide-binding universal stress UspA family protein
MFTKILVPLDGSALAEKALPFAADTAKAHGAKLVLLRVIHLIFLEEPVTEAEQTVIAKEKERAGKYLEGVAKELRVEGLGVKADVGEGEIANTVLETAKAEGCDLICMTTHGFSGVERFIWGSIAEKVVRASNIPVLLIRAIPVTITAMEAEARVGA